MIRRLAMIGMCVLMFGCGGSLQEAAQTYTDTSAALTEISQLFAADWPYWSGFLQGSFKDIAALQYIVDEIKEFDSWFMDNKGVPLESVVLNKFQLGQLDAFRIRMAGPVFRETVRAYFPGLMNFSGLVSFFSFVGL